LKSEEKENREVQWWVVVGQRKGFGIRKKVKWKQRKKMMT